MRALRVDKMTYAALEATLEEYAVGRADAVPVMRMLRATPADRHPDAGGRAGGPSRRMEHGHRRRVFDGGGGSSPGSQLPTRLLRLERPGLSASEIEQHLRCSNPPVVARIHDGHVVLDLRTLLPNQDRLLAALLAQDDQTER